MGKIVRLPLDERIEEVTDPDADVHEAAYDHREPICRSEPLARANDRGRFECCKRHDL